LARELYGVALAKAREKKSTKVAETVLETKGIQNRASVASGGTVTPSTRVTLGSACGFSVCDLTADAVTPVGARAVKRTDSGASASACSSSKLTGHGFNVVPASLKRQLDQAVFEHIILSNHPFAESSSRTFRRIFSIGIPGYKPPTANHVGGKMLDTNYAVTKAAVWKRILNGTHATVLMDGTSDPAQVGIVNVLLKTFNIHSGDAEVFFLKNITVQAYQRESSQFLSSVVREVISVLEMAYHDDVRVSVIHATSQLFLNYFLRCVKRLTG
jgi:hypothetical protein